MNTDPWVFGERMLYSSYKQMTDKGGTPTAMQKLTRCSVSALGPPSTARSALRQVDDVFRVCTLEASATAKRASPVLTLYRGAAYTSQWKAGLASCARAAPRKRLRVRAIGSRPPGFISLANRRST
jgi:hypothetical protein